MTRYQFWVDIHALPPTPLAHSRLELGGQWFETLLVPEGSASTPLPVSFEEACAGLNRLPQLLIEPDGSFVWSASQGEPAWQIDGVLYDRAGKLIYVELKGACPSAQFDELLTHLRLAGNPDDVSARPRSRFPRRSELPPRGRNLACRLSICFAQHQPDARARESNERLPRWRFGLV